MSGLVHLSGSTKAYQGVEVLKNYATGTQVAKYVDGTKNVVLGSGNSLSKLFGEGATITLYPKGSLMGGKDGTIMLAAKGAENALAFTQKEFGEFVNMMKALAKNSVK